MCSIFIANRPQPAIAQVACQGFTWQAPWKGWALRCRCHSHWFDHVLSCFLAPGFSPKDCSKRSNSWWAKCRKPVVGTKKGKLLKTNDAFWQAFHDAFTGFVPANLFLPLRSMRWQGETYAGWLNLSTTQAQGPPIKHEVPVVALLVEEVPHCYSYYDYHRQF